MRPSASFLIFCCFSFFCALRSAIFSCSLIALRSSVCFLLFCFLFTLSFESFTSVRDEILQLKKPPLKLSDYGFFEDMQSQLPSENVLPYTLESALFSDYADKLRFIYIPENKTAAYRHNKVFDFPNGTALIKTFAYLNNYQNFLFF